MIRYWSWSGPCQGLSIACPGPVRVRAVPGLCLVWVLAIGPGHGLEFGIRAGTELNPGWAVSGSASVWGRFPGRTRTGPLGVLGGAGRYLSHTIKTREIMCLFNRGQVLRHFQQCLFSIQVHYEIITFFCKNAEHLFKIPSVTLQQEPLPL
jgi:hypothetical protein